MYRIILMLALLVFGRAASAQQNPLADPGTSGMSWVPNVIGYGQNTILTASIGNYGSQPIPANTIKWQLILPVNLQYVEVENLSQIPFAIMNGPIFEPGIGTLIEFTNTAVLNPTAFIPPATFVFGTYDLKLKAIGLQGNFPNSMGTVMNTSIITGNATQVGNNTTTNDGAIASIQVMPDPTPLPINLLSFTGNEKSCGVVELNWQSSMEKNVHKFLVQYSSDGKNFTSIGSVNAKNALSGAQYSYAAAQTDREGYYRLMVQDKDERYTLSNVLKVKINCNEHSISVAPNPASNSISVSGLMGTETIVFINITGQTVITQKAKVGENVLEIEHLPAGNYNLVIKEQNGESKTYKVVKQ